MTSSISVGSFRRGIVPGLLAIALAIGTALAAAACGDNLRPLEPDADLPLPICSNGTVEAGEDCDDGDQVRDPLCDDLCHFTCGNGDVDTAFSELCDTGIASGTGACPTSCDDGMACTQDSLDGSDCQASCVNAAITAAADGDGCCPPGATSLTDDDCTIACGNMLVEAGEACDTGITAGAGMCPTSCNDNLTCTTDTLRMGGTCQATCTNAPITTPINNDMCCPPGATPANDTDCAGCGDGTVTPPETCDTAINAGNGRCPTACNDNMACTRDTLSGGGTCMAACSFAAITTPTNGDGCCPTGANSNNDNDCAPRCGNTVVEAGEQCDDGNLNNSDACSNLCRLNVTAFKFTDLDLRDPHAYVSFLGCRDVTPHGAFGFSVNDELQTNISTDGDNPPDGLLDLAPTLVFRTFNQTAATQPVELHFANCTAPQSSTSCSAGTGTVTMATATYSATGTCLTFLPNTVRPYNPVVGPASGPGCFTTSAVTVTLDLGGIPITLRDARIGGRYSGNPATGLTNGLLMGFISQADANTTVIPASFPIVGGQPLSSLLPGGAGNCNCNANCGTANDDKDTNNGTIGWWFYLNFTASRVPWT